MMTAHSRSRGIEIVRALWGLVLLTRPRAVNGSLHLRDDRRAVIIARILGARHLTQATLSGVRPTQDVLAMGVWVDAVHAATAAGLAAVDPARGRAAGLDVVIASAWAGIGWHDLATGRAVSGSRQGRRDRLAQAVLRVSPGGKYLLRLTERNDMTDPAHDLPDIPRPQLLDAHRVTGDLREDVTLEDHRNRAQQASKALEESCAYAGQLWDTLAATRTYLHGHTPTPDDDQAWEQWQDTYASVVSVLCGPHGDSGFGASQAQVIAQLRRAR